jgi:CCR4-NOT transcription complex subunit 4
MSSAARALLDEVQIRRETLAASATISPFPDLDRTLQTLCGENGESGGFSFNLDPKLVGDDAEISEDFPNFEAEANMPFHGTYMDAFPALRPQTQGSSGAFMNPPGLPYVHNPARSIYDPLSVRASPIERQSTGGSNYTGSFNPFADGNDDSSARKAQCMPLDDDSGRKMSRFGFARGRQGSTAASSPLHNPSPLSNQDGHSPFFNTRESASPSMTHWSPPPHQPEFAYYQAGSAMGSPLVQQAQAPTAAYPQHQSRFQPFDSGVSEAQLRDLIHSSRSERGS